MTDRGVPERVRFFQPVGIGFWIFLALLVLLQIVLDAQPLWLLPVALLGGYLWICTWRWTAETWWLRHGLSPERVASSPRYLAVILLFAMVGLLSILVSPSSWMWTGALALIFLWDLAVPWVLHVR